MNRSKVCGPTLAHSLGVARGAAWGATGGPAMECARLDAALLHPSRTPVNVATLRGFMRHVTGRGSDVYGSETLLLVLVVERGFCWRPSVSEGGRSQCYAGVYAGLPGELFDLAVSRGAFRCGDARDCARAIKRLRQELVGGTLQ